MKHSLSHRVALYLAALATLLLTVSLAGFGWVAYRSSLDLGERLTRGFEEARTLDATETLRRSGAYLSNRLFNPLYSLDISGLAEEIERVRAWLPATDFLVLDSHRRVVTDGTPENRRYGQSLDVPPDVVPGAPVIRDGRERSTLFIAIGFGDETAGFAVVELSNAAAARSLAELRSHSDALWGQLRRYLAYAAAATLALVAASAFLLSWWLSRVLSWPLAQMSSTARDLAAGNLDRTLEARSPDEVGDLARSLNRMAAQLKKSASLLAKSQEMAKLGSWEWQGGERRLHLSPGACRLLGLPDPGSRVSTLALDSVLALLAEQDREPARSVLTGEPLARTHCEVSFYCPDGSTRTLQISGERDARDGAAGCDLLGTFQDVTERREYERQLAYLANYDALTGLPNRNLFQERLHQAMHQADRQGTQVALLFLDLDRFKAVNDALGHAAGDRLLQGVARRLGEILQGEDCLARIGGDELTAIVEDANAEERAAELCERLLAALARSFTVGERELVVSASIGITLYPRDARDLDTLLRTADTAMYLAKEQGKNTYRFFTAELDRRAHARLSLEHSLRRALREGELEIHYQPQVRIRDLRLVGAEALVRWCSPEGPISPTRFLPVLEDTGLIAELTPLVLAEACTFARDCAAHGLGDLRVSVNLAARELQKPGLPDLVRGALQGAGLPPHLLEIEITEGTLLDADSSRTNAEALTAMGTRLALDDFGTGYSSLTYLKRYAVDCLKVDRSFVRDILSDRDDASIVAAVVALATRLGIEVVAEGVENAEQLALLRDLGCDLAQGFLFAPALPRAHFLSWAQAHANPPRTIRDEAAVAFG